MSVVGIGDDDEKESEYFKTCTLGELNGMYLSSARLGDWPRIERLLAAGAELDFAGGAALTAAIDTDNIEVARKLLARGMKVTPYVLHEAMGDAVYAGNARAVAFMVDEAKADPTNNDSCYLFSAVVNNKPDVTRMLLQKGAKPDANKGTLLCIALSHDFNEAAEALLEGGADPRWTHMGMNAWEWAAKQKSPDMLRALRGDVRATDAYMSPGFFARQTLAELRGFYDERQKESGLHLAARACCFDVVRDKILNTPGERLTAKDLTAREPGGKDVLTLLGERSELKKAFDPRLWSGRRDEALMLLEKKVPREFRDQVDIHGLVATLDAEILKDRAKNAPRLKKPKP